MSTITNREAVADDEDICRCFAALSIRFLCDLGLASQAIVCHGFAVKKMIH